MFELSEFWLQQIKNKQERHNFSTYQVYKAILKLPSFFILNLEPRQRLSCGLQRPMASFLTALF